MMIPFDADRISLILAASALLVPLLAFATIMLVIRSRHALCAAVSIGAAGVACLCACVLLIRHWQMTAPLVFETTWLSFGRLSVPLGIVLDPISLLMLTTVAVVCLLVQCYSLGYMAGDPGFGRYFGWMSLFAWAMLSLTIASSLLQLYIFWELVGLSSYLLIGFWFEKFSAGQAGKKAFVMTRLGDICLLLGLILIWLHTGDLDLIRLSDPAAVRAHLSPGMITVAALLIMGGIIGKSAQFPLLTWLPDAMQGPTPVSALLHSATMVAAGVYLFVRLFGFFALSSTAMTVCLAVGTISMLLASTMAMVGRDIKQVWAYSTISQLGYMLMGLGSGGLIAGYFHLMTHAGFKALLFLTAGVFIHQYTTNDIYRLANSGARRLKPAVLCMVVAAGALSGVPPLSGFFSKELILAQLYGLQRPFWFWTGIAGVFLTAYYSFRLVWIMVTPQKMENDPRMDAPHENHGGCGTMAMSAVLWVLASATLVLGLLQTPIERFIGRGPGGQAFQTPVVHSEWLPVVPVLSAVAAIVLTWMEFGRRGSAQIGFIERVPALAQLFAQRWYIDHGYRWMLEAWVDRGVSRWFAWNDKHVIDGAVDGLGNSTITLGKASAKWHTGPIQRRLMVMFAVIAILLLYFGLGA